MWRLSKVMRAESERIKSERGDVEECNGCCSTGKSKPVASR